MSRLTALVVLLLCYSAISQESINTTLVTFPETHTAGWNTYVSNSDFEIQYQFIECDPDMGYDHESVILKIENKTSNTLDLNWHIAVYYDNDCKTCAYPVEYSRTIQLAPNEIIEGSCDRNTNKQLKMFSKYIDQDYSQGLPLTGFQLISLTSTLIE